MKVSDLTASRKDVYSVTDDTTVHDAARYLRDKEVRAVGVLDNRGRLVGVLSQSDIPDKVAAENKCPAWMRVAEIMSTDLITVSPGMPLEDCLHLMDKHGIYHLLVVDEGGIYRGMISVTDLLRVIASDHKARADMLEAYVFPQRWLRQIALPPGRSLLRIRQQPAQELVQPRAIFVADVGELNPHFLAGDRTSHQPLRAHVSSGSFEQQLHQRPDRRRIRRGNEQPAQAQRDDPRNLPRRPRLPGYRDSFGYSDPRVLSPAVSRLKLHQEKAYSSARLPPSAFALMCSLSRSDGDNPIGVHRDQTSRIRTISPSPRNPKSTRRNP
jgi:CBS domain-containing protein